MIGVKPNLDDLWTNSSPVLTLLSLDFDCDVCNLILLSDLTRSLSRFDYLIAY